MFLFGALFTLATSYAAGAAIFPRTPIPAVVRFALGSALLSLAQFALLLCGAGPFPYFLAIPLIAWVLYKRPVLLREPIAQPLDPISRWILFPILAAYAVFYLVNALAPEIQPDAMAYHLALPAEYLRLGRFPARVGFYEMLPQGLEMLFTVAMAHGDYSSAKLVHFSFLLATFPLLLLIARRLKFPDLAAYAAATLYFTAPVVGISGSSAYNDAALVFFTLATFYLVLYNGALAGIPAGFCFALKLTGLLVPVLAFVYLISRRPSRRNAVLLFSAGAALLILPWMLRDLILTGNPVAPLFNSLFPNPYFSASGDQALARTLTTYGGFHWYSAPWNWAFGGAFQGVTGPLLFLLPLALLAWRKPRARIVLYAGLLLLLPVLFNVGTRFLMPALPLLLLAVALVLPRPAVWACVLLQAVLCIPAVLTAWGQPYSWILTGFPWRVALRVDSATHYLEARGGDYSLAKMVESATQPQDRVFALTGIANAYTTREVLEFWHSTQARQLTDALQTALLPPQFDRLSAQWPARTLYAVRVVANADAPAPLKIFDIRLYYSNVPLLASSRWSVEASPNVWDAPRALDGNRATYWSSLAPQRSGMFLEADFNHSELLDLAELLLERTGGFPSVILQGKTGPQGPWLPLASAFQSSAPSEEDLRHEAGRAVKTAGFSYILTTIGDSGLGPVGADLLQHPREWGVELTVRLGDVCLFHLL